MDEVRLGVILLQASDLVWGGEKFQVNGRWKAILGKTRRTVDVVVVGVVPKEMLHRIPRKRKATVVVDGLPGRERKEEHRLSSCHARATLSEDAPERVEDETF